MKIYVYTVCWNEQKLAKHFIEHYSKFCEKIIIYDNESTDNTLQKLVGDKVEVRTFKSDGLRDDFNREIKNNCWKEARGIADFVIVCDFDEFLYHKNLYEFLEKNKNFSIFHPDVFDMITEDDFEDNVNLIEYCKYGYLVEDIYHNKMNKCILFNPNKIEDINYSEGSHRLGINNLDSILYYNQKNYELKILHYKYLTLNYTLNRKNIICKRLSEFNRNRHWGFHNCMSDEWWINRFNQAKIKSVNVLELE